MVEKYLEERVEGLNKVNSLKLDKEEKLENVSCVA